MLAHLQHFNTPKILHQKEPVEEHKAHKDSQVSSNEVYYKKEVQLLEIYVEKSKSMTLGQRLSWHLNLINKQISLPCIPDEHEFYLKAVNVSYKEDLKHDQQKLHDLVEGGIHESNNYQNSAQYCQDSNTVFYYSEYKVLLLLDFSKSTSTIYPHQTKSYVEKLQDSIEIFIHNLWFKLNNKYCKKEQKGRSRGHSGNINHVHHEADFNPSPQITHNDCQKGFNQIIQEVNDESDEFSSPFVAEEVKVQEKVMHEQEIPHEYNPTIYLSIVASGLPPSNNMRILVHNQKLDDNNRTEVLKSLHSRLQGIEQQLCESFNSSNFEQNSPSANPMDPNSGVKQEEYLQRHLCNAQKILNMMRTGAKPLLVLLTDSTNSLMVRGSGGESLDTAISRLHAADTKIITVDLGDENKVGNTFGYVNHDEHLKYLAYVTCGAHFDYSTLIKLAGIFSENYMGYQQIKKHNISQTNTLDRISQANQYTSNSKISQRNSFGLGILDSLSHNKLNNLAGIKAGSILNLALQSVRHSVQKQHQDLSQNDQFHSQLNSLQKLMFARPCNYSRFLQFQEIQQLVNYQERLIFENRVSTDLIKRLRKDKELTVNPSFSVSELLLNGKYVPIFRKEQLSEYRLESCSRASQICEYRSRMCFQFRKLKVAEQKGSSPLDRPGSKIYYQYWWSNQILILCCIEQIRTQENHRQVHVTYKLVAQEEVIDKIKRDRKELFSKSKNGASQQHLQNNGDDAVQPKLLLQLQNFLQEIQKCDQHFEVFEAIQSDIKRTFNVVHQRQSTMPGKYIQKIGYQKKDSQQRQHEDNVNHEDAKAQEDKTKQEEQQQDQPESIPAKPKTNKFASSEEQAIKIYQRHRKNWYDLLKIPLCHWPQLLIYGRLDIVTQSSFEQAALHANAGVEILSLIDQIQKQDEALEKTLLEQLLAFTSFQINHDTFIQVFQDHRGGERVVNGFCIIKIQWAAHNIAVCHLGFYQVSPKLQSNFTSQLKKVLTTDIQKVYEKQVASLLVQEQRAFIKYCHSNNEEKKEVQFEQSFMKNKKDKFQSFYLNQLPASINDLCYNKSWQWKNDNSLTNKDFFDTLIRQRLKEGFIFVNRDQSKDQPSTKFLFIKLLKAYKQKIGKLVGRNSNQLNEDSERFGKLGGRRFSKIGEDHGHMHSLINDKHHCMDISNETDVVLQYVMHVDNRGPHHELNNFLSSQNLTFRTELLMEHESGFFFIEKQHHCHQHFGSTASLENLLKKDQDQVSCQPDKNFFPKLSEYIFEVDKFLFNNICTYHNIIKNSILKMVEVNPNNQNADSLIKSEVCYFKNIFTQEVEQALHSEKSRKRLKLEFSIKSKMQMLKRDWGEFLRNSYPELFQSQARNNASDLISNKTLNIKTETHSNNVKLIDESSFQPQIQDFIDNLKVIGKEVLLIPDYLFNNRPVNFKEIVSSYYDSILRVYEEFSDFKLKKSNENIIQSHQDKYHYFIKLVTKQILFLIKLPSKNEYLNSVIYGKGEDSSLEVEYYRATKRMIRISKKLSKSPYLHMLNPDYHLNHEGFRERLHSHQLGSEQPLSHQNCSDFDVDDLIYEDEEENINQIDQICDFLFYYESDLREGSQQLQFEPHVQTIIDNFCNYLKTNFDIIFAETVLMNLPEEETIQHAASSNRRSRKSSNISNDEILLTIKDYLQNDFAKMKKTMTKCRFKLDISFLCQMINEILVKQTKYIDGQELSQKMFKDALDEVFHQIITRNFRLCETDAELFVFKKNLDLDEEGNYPADFNNKEESKFDQRIRDEFLYNLEGTKDSYSDSEEETRRNVRRSFSNLANQFNNKSQQLGSSSCKKLMFKIDLIVRNLKGEKVLEKKLERLSEVFDRDNQSVISQVCQDLAKKAQYIVEERRHELKVIQENKIFLESEQFMDLVINEETLFLTNHESSRELQDHKETQSAVEIYFSFYTIPQYVGIIRDQDIDYLCNENQDEILVNDDDHEDLIRVSKLNHLLEDNNHKPHCIQQRLEFEDLTPFKENTWSLFKSFNKKQLVKSIPYYFKHGDKQSKDYRIYYYDEIQRKLIYGMMRRSYALIAQSFIEYLSLITNEIDPLNIITLQKYMGALLDNQRRELKFKVLDKLGNKTRQAIKFLTDDLKQSNILNVTHVKMTQDKNNAHDELFFVKSQQHLRNFYLRHQVDQEQIQIPLNFADNESGFQDEDQIQLKQFVSDINELEAIESQQKKYQQEPFEIPFWLIFRLVHQQDTSNQNSVYVECAYHLPNYKNHAYLDENIVEKELHRCIDIISRRANIIMLLNQVEQTKQMPLNLILNEQKDETASLSNLSQANHQQTLNRIEQNKNRNALMSVASQDSEQSKPTIQKTISSQSSMLSSVNPQPSVTQVQKLSTSITSKFKKRMGKFNQVSSIDNSSDVTSTISKEIINSNFTPPNFKIPNEKQETYRVNKVFEYEFPLKHSSIKSEDGIKAIEKTLFNYFIENKPNMFVLKKDNNVYIIKIFSQGLSQNDSIAKQNTLRSYSSQPHQSYVQMSANHQTISNQDAQMIFFTHGITGDESINSKNKDLQAVNSSGIPNQATKTSKFGNNLQYQVNQNSIAMEVYSSSNCLKSHILNEIKLIEINFAKMILEKIAENIMKHFGTISQEDFSYIERSDQKMVYAFPLNDQLVTDHYALIQYLKQNLSRILIPIQSAPSVKTVKSHHLIENTSQSMNLSPDIKIPSTFSTNLNTMQQSESSIEAISQEASEQYKNQTIQYKWEDFQLLYNYNPKFSNKTSKENQKEDPKNQKYKFIKQHLGESLAIAGLSILENFNSAEIFAPEENLQNYSEQVQSAFKKYLISNFKIEEPIYQEDDTSKVYGINKLIQDTTLKSKMKICMPLIFHSFKDTQEENSSSRVFSRFKNMNDVMKIPLPMNRESNQKWLVVQLSVLGQLEKENFSKNVILNMHQALAECIIEQFIQTNFSLDNSTQRSSKQDKPIINNGKTTQTTLSKNLEYLELFLQQQTISLTSMVDDFEILIYGDQSDIICTLISSFITNFHSEFKSYTQGLPNAQSYPGNQWYLNLIIEFINKNTSKLEQTVVYTFGETLNTQIYEKFQKELKIILSKTKTILRNIHPQFKIVLGSFKIYPIIDTVGKQLIYRDLTQQFQFEGLRPDDQASPNYHQSKLDTQQLAQQQTNKDDRLSSIKLCSNIIAPIDSNQKMCLPRSFMMILSVKDQKLNLKTFNLNKIVVKRCKEIISDQLLWNSNRQNFLKRIVSQKLGTVYTLKDYYSSTHLIKDQTLDTLYQNNKYMYEKTATLIEGKQIYDFKKVIKRQRRRTRKQQHPEEPILEDIQRRRRPRKEKQAVQENKIKDNPQPVILSGSNNLQVQAEEYLKSLKIEEDLKNLYKKIKINNNSTQQNQKIDQSDTNTNKQGDYVDNENAKLKAKKTYYTVPYIEFIQNKVIKKSLQHRDKNIELKLVNMYVISPSLQPSRANIILSEIEKYDQQEFLRQSSNKKQYFVDHITSTSEHNNKLIVYNPIFFHGMRMIKMLKCYFQRVKNSQQLALVYTKCEDLVSRKFVTSKNVQQQEQFKKLFEKISAGQSIQNQLYEVENLISKSRLLYTNITQQLFDDNHTHYYEDFQHNASVIGHHDHPNIMAKKQLEEMRKNLLTEYNNFLLSKIGVKNSICFMFSSNPNDQVQMQLGKQNAKNNINSLHSIKMKHADDGLYSNNDYIVSQFSKTHHNPKLKKNSDDFQESLEGDKPIIANAHGSNSSLVISSNHQDSNYATQLFSRIRKERVLQEISEEGQDSQHKLYSYIAKTLFDDSIVIYELKYQNGLIRINVYKFDSMIKTFPRNIFSDYNIYFSDINVRREKRQAVVKEVHYLSTRLNSDSFNYDFHLKEISNQISVKSKKSFNVSRQLFNILSYYKSPPKFSKNFIDVVVLKYDLGQMNGIKDLDFLAFFCSKHKEYQFKILNQPIQKQSPALQGISQKYSSSFIGNAPMQSLTSSPSKPEEECKGDQVQYSFFKEEGLKPKVENLDHYNANKRSTSVASQSQLNQPQVQRDRKYSANNLERVEERDEDQEELKVGRSESDFRKPQAKATSSFVGSKNQGNEPTSKKLFYVELKNSAIHHDFETEHCDVYKKVWNVQCRKQETTVSEIFQTKEEIEQKTIIELVFYMIYTVPLTNNQVDENGLPYDLRTNSERYPLKEIISQDMTSFIDSLEMAFSECRKELLKDQLWQRFFDQTKKNPLTDAQIHDMLKFSYQVDFRHFDERYRDIFQMNLYNRRLNDQLRKIFGKKCYSFTNNLQLASQAAGDQQTQILPDLLIFDPEITNSLIHIDFNQSQKTVKAYFVTKDKSQIFDKDIKSENGHSNDIQYIKANNQVKKVINHITFWLWKKAI